jgi:ATP-binding cassette subfamily B protein
MKVILALHRIAKEMRLLAQRMREVWNLVPRQRKFALAGAALLMTFTSASNTVVAVFLGRLVDSIQKGLEENWTAERMYVSAGTILGIISGMYLVREGLHVYRRYLVQDSCTRMNRDMQMRAVGHLLKTDLSALGQEKIGAQHSKIFRSVEGLIQFVRLMFLDCLPALFTGLFALAAAAYKQPLVGCIMLGVAPLAILITIRQLISQKDIRLKLMRDCEEIDGAVVEQLGGAEYIRVANTYALEMQRLAQITEHRRRREIKHHFEMSLYGCAKALNEGLFHVIVLGLATYLAIHERISFGDVLTFSVLYLNVMAPLNEVHRVLDEGHEASLRVGDLLELLRTPLDRSFQTRSSSALALRAQEPAVEIEILVVDYDTPDGRTKRVLDGVSLRIQHGETIGIAGPSGCGKSTWIKALLRLIHPREGSIRLGGVPLDDLNRAELARNIGYVGQLPFVFSGTIAENIVYGREDVSADDVHHAAGLANLQDEILEMSHGYETVISERGANLSGGQRQRLAIARMLLKGAPILILDEATSALDNISERYVQRALGITSTDRTTILVAHRLSTLRDCDRIFVFDAGRIVEVGTYDELLHAGGLFSTLVALAENGIDELTDMEQAEADKADRAQAVASQ